LGVIAREYEVTQLVQLLQTLGQDSPMYPMLVSAVIDNMGLSNREELMAQMQQASQPNPEAQKAQQAMQMQMQMASATTTWFRLKQWKLKHVHRSTQSKLNWSQRWLRLRWQQLSLPTYKRVTLTMLNLPNEPRLLNLMLKEADIKSNERIAAMQVS
jgi:hypothetical protein